MANEEQTSPDHEALLDRLVACARANDLDGMRAVVAAGFDLIEPALTNLKPLVLKEGRRPKGNGLETFKIVDAGSITASSTGTTTHRSKP